MSVYTKKDEAKDKLEDAYLLLIEVVNSDEYTKEYSMELAEIIKDLMIIKFKL